MQFTMMGTTSMSWHAPAWATQTPEDVEEADEPPEPSSPNRFRRTQVKRPNEQTSLLTKALMGGSDNDDSLPQHSDFTRRRSMASNVSIASTADLTSDTGFTSPARTNTPSPPVPELLISRLNRLDIQGQIPSQLDTALDVQSRTQVARSHDEPKVAPRKRCIQFACGAKPSNNTSTSDSTTKQTSVQDAPARKTCIKFTACPTRQSSKNTPPQQTGRIHQKQAHSPTTPKREPATPSTPRQANFRRSSDHSVSRPKFLRANSTDLVNDGSQFHEFASETSREDDWIRHANTSANHKLTINDTLVKENQIRRLAKEAEEEAELEEDEEEAAIDDEEDEDEEDEDEDEDIDDGDLDEDEDELEDELSDGYHTDEETGFAESDESDAEDGNMALWTLSKSPRLRPTLNAPVSRRPSLQGHQSDSSTTTGGSPRRTKMKRVKPQPEAPDLPDSTDFVCGTLDEDRPLEEAYLSCLAARRNEKLRVIPQDIDPSFPASEPEDEDDEDIYNPVHHDSDDDLVGEMEDIHHGQDRPRRRRKSDLASPRKCRSPAPKRLHSPPPKRLRSPPPKKHHSPRGRSPKLLFDRQSPRRPRSPAPRVMVTPRGSPRQGIHVKFNLAARPGPTITKSLPRPGIFTSRKNDRHYMGEYVGVDLPVRGAIDIVKGLEKKRQRRKEKFQQKYCNRARRGQIPERKPQPGRGALRMRELGLLMAGKKDQGNYVLSI